MSSPIVFFDGVCNLCNGFVDFLIRHDSEGKIMFAPLQGETAKQKLPPQLSKELKSVVLLREGKIFEKSDAALMILTSLGGIWALGNIFWLFPTFFRNWIYEQVAKYRYRLFGKRETCRLPTPSERKRFLD